MNPSKITRSPLHAMEGFIFWSRWLQAPLYLGLIVAQGVYVYQFMLELVHLVAKAGSLTDTFVSRLDLEDNPDQPEWLSHVNAGVLKVKLATAIISISSIHLLKTFINAANIPQQAIMWQVVIHVTFLFSALAIAWTDKIMTESLLMSKKH